MKLENLKADEIEGKIKKNKKVMINVICYSISKLYRWWILYTKEGIFSDKSL